MIRIYFAGPLFSTYERRFIEECADRLRSAGFEVCVPHETLGAKREEESAELEKMDLRQEAVWIFDGCYEGIAWANVMIAMLDGTQVDDGTASEIGTFNQMMLSGDGEKLAMFGLSSDIRVGPESDHLEAKGLNSYTVGAIYKTGGNVYTNIDDIIDELRKLQEQKQS